MVVGGDGLVIDAEDCQEHRRDDARAVLARSAVVDDRMTVSRGNLAQCHHDRVSVDLDLTHVVVDEVVARTGIDLLLGDAGKREHREVEHGDRLVG